MGENRAGPETARQHPMLLAAGRHLAESAGAEAVTPAAVAGGAGLSEAGIVEHFGTWPEYLAALIESMLDGLRDEIVAATATLPPGTDRVWRSIETYLDGNLRRRPMRALILGGRLDEVITGMVRRRTHGYGMLINMELASLGVRNAPAAGRLCAVLAVEAATAEYEAGRALPELRACLRSYLERVAMQ